jgi:hypothetical protein
MIVACKGIIRVARISQKKRPFPGNGRRANA